MLGSGQAAGGRPHVAARIARPCGDRAMSSETPALVLGDTGTYRLVASVPGRKVYSDAVTVPVIADTFPAVIVSAAADATYRKVTLVLQTNEAEAKKQEGIARDKEAKATEQADERKRRLPIDAPNHLRFIRHVFILAIPLGCLSRAAL